MWVVSEEGTGADDIHGDTITVPEKDNNRPRTSKSSLDAVRASFLVKFPEPEHTV